ncbi:MAG: ATP-binding protein [Pseudomonadota bacterium]
MPRPRSILVLIISGFILVASPLIAAVVWSYVSVTELSRQGEEVVARGVEITQLSQRLPELVVDIKRYAQQYVLLGDQEILSLHRERHASLADTITELRSRVGEGADTAPLDNLQDDSAAILEILEQRAQAENDDGEAAAPGDGGEETAADGAEPPITADAFEAMQSAAAAWLVSSRNFINSEAAVMREAAAEARSQMVVQASGTVALALAMMLLFTPLIARPVQQLKRAIRQLRGGDYNQGIRVGGPRDLHSLGDDLDSLRNRLEQSEEDKKRFLRHMSHEMKTPLAGLLEGTALFTDGSLGTLSDPQTEVAEILRSNSEEMRHLIENLLDYNAWQEHKGSISISRFSFGNLIQQVLDQHAMALLAKNITVDQAITPLYLSADREKIRTVLSNLISNAVKYTPQGSSIHLRSFCHQDQLVFDVADDGPNVSPKERQRIFEPFFTGTPPKNSHMHGTGIGLSLVNEYVAAHGGSISLMDGSYTGAHFRMQLPIGESAIYTAGPGAEDSVEPAVTAEQEKTAANQ